MPGTVLGFGNTAENKVSDLISSTDREAMTNTGQLYSRGNRGLESQMLSFWYLLAVKPLDDRHLAELFALWDLHFLINQGKLDDLQTPPPAMQFVESQILFLGSSRVSYVGQYILEYSCQT